MPSVMSSPRIRSAPTREERGSIEGRRLLLDAHDVASRACSMMACGAREFELLECANRSVRHSVVSQ